MLIRVVQLYQPPPAAARARSVLSHPPPHPILCPLQWWPSSKSDPYAVVNIGDSAAATSVINQELNPQWGESFYLFAR